jgi:hypothetical protein
MGHKIREILRDSAFDETVSQVEGAAWTAFESASIDFVRNLKSLTEELVNACKFVVTKVSLTCY